MADNLTKKRLAAYPAVLERRRRREEVGEEVVLSIPAAGSRALQRRAQQGRRHLLLAYQRPTMLVSVSVVVLTGPLGEMRRAEEGKATAGERPTEEALQASVRSWVRWVRWPWRS